jgi:hypothetical protein
MAGQQQFREFCEAFVSHFVDETDPRQRFERFARLMVEEILRPGAHLTYAVDVDPVVAIMNLRAALRPALEQEGLWVIAPAFFGGVSVEDTALLLEEFADFVEDPENYEAPDLDEDEDEDEEQEAAG